MRFTKKWIYVLGAVALTCLMSTRAFAVSTVLDFSTGLAGQGGTITLLTGNNVSGVNIPIGALTVVGAPTTGANGVWVVTGGLLNFNTSTGAITITGSVTVNGSSISGTLLSGTITQWDTTLISQGLISATGFDSKNPALLSAVGLPLGTSFNFFGFSIVTRPLLSVGASSAAISTDIRNTAVPEPSTILLFGLGLVGVAVWGRKRLQR